MNIPASIAERFNQAALLAAELDLDLDTYMRAAWQSYMDARPGLREHLEELRLTAEIDQIRRAGKLAAA